jgi:hypothetical protein
MVFALDEHNGAILWTYPELNEDFLSSPAVYGGGGGLGKPEVIVGWRGGGGGGGGGVYALNESNGLVLWMRTSDAIGYSSPAIAGNGLVYVGTETGILLCLNATDGSQKWSYTTGGPIEASPSITDDHVIVGSMSGEVYCWGPSFPEHDVQVSRAVATIDSNLGTITTNYTITNVGNVGETVNVDLAYNTTDVGSPPESPMPTIFHTDRITITAGEHADETYTTTLPKGNYTITVTADPVPGETNMTYNDRVAGRIQVGNFDVGIMSATPSKYLVKAGTPITVNIVVKNEGDYTETFNVTLYGEMLWGWEEENDTFPLYVFTGVTLTPGSTRTLTVSITLDFFPLSTYALKAYAWPVPGETHVSDNTCTGGYIRVLSPKIHVHWFYGRLGCGAMPL